MKPACVNVFGECRYTAGCEFGCIAARQQMQFAPSPPSHHGAREVKPLTEDDVRRIVREELARDLAERKAKLRAFVAEVHGAGNPAGDPIMDSRCEYLYPPSGRCDKCGNVHDGKPPVVNFPIPSQGTAQEK